MRKEQAQIPIEIPTTATELALADEFISAQFSLTSNQLRAYILLIACIQASTTDTVIQESDKPVVQVSPTMFSFDAISMGKRLGFHGRAARGSMVAELFEKIMKSTIRIQSRTTNADNEISFMTATFISTVTYDSTSHWCYVGIPETIIPFINSIIKGGFLRVEADAILALHSATTIRIFLLVRNLERKGITQIPIKKFRDIIGVANDSNFRDYNKQVIKKAVKEIKEKTAFTEFFIEDDGARGRQATIFSFGVTRPKERQEILEARAHLLGIDKQELRDISDRFSPRVSVMISKAMQKGFDPKFIGNRFDNLSDDRICANIQIVLDRIKNDTTSDKKHSSDEYGRFFLTAVINDWAGSGKKKEEALKKVEQSQAAVRSMEMAETDTDEYHIRDEAIDMEKRVAEYISNLSLSELTTLCKKNMATLSKMGKKYGFDIAKATTRKKIFREYRILCQFVKAQAVLGNIKLPLVAPKELIEKVPKDVMESLF